jgi:hypothetical protein
MEGGVSEVVEEEELVDVVVSELVVRSLWEKMILYHLSDCLLKGERVALIFDYTTASLPRFDHNLHLLPSPLNWKSTRTHQLDRVFTESIDISS